MTTLAQRDVPVDPEILRTATENKLLFPLLAKKLPSVGIYASIVRGGTIRDGDAVRVEGTSAMRRVGTYMHAIKRAVRRR
jgi:MOSC domain-containing protein YiiM